MSLVTFDLIELCVVLWVLFLMELWLFGFCCLFLFIIPSRWSLVCMCGLWFVELLVVGVYGFRFVLVFFFWCGWMLVFGCVVSFFDLLCV